MGHFTIELPNNFRGDVRWGSVIKVEKSILNLFRRKSFDMEEKTGYIIKLLSQVEHKKTYHLYKSKDEKWYLDIEETLPVETDDTAIIIKEAIVKYQSQVEEW